MRDDEQIVCATSARIFAMSTLLRHDLHRVLITSGSLASLSFHLGIAVEIDDSGRCIDVAVRYQIEPDGQLRALAVRAPRITVVKRLVALDVINQVNRYNAEIGKARSLRDRVACAVYRVPEPSPRIRDAYRYLARVDGDIESRQARLMRGGVVGLAILCDEIRFWQHYYEHFSAITGMSEEGRAAAATTDSLTGREV